MTTRADAARRPDKRAARPIPRREVYRLSESPSHLLRRAEQFAAEMFIRSELREGVTLRQTVLLAAIAEAEGASQSDLVRTTGVDRSTLAEMMARMEKRGLIARSAAADDGRAKSVSLTSQGRRRLDEALPAMRQVDRALLAAIPAHQRQAFRAVLMGLADTADRQSAAAEDAPRPARKTAAAGRRAPPPKPKGGRRARKR